MPGSHGIISILLPNLKGGGAERISIDLARAFTSMGHSVEFVLMEATGDFLSEALSDFSVVNLDCARARELPLAVAGYLRRRCPDAMLASMWPLTAVAPVARLIAGSRCSLVVAEHNVISVQYQGWGRSHNVQLRASVALAYRMANSCVGVSSGVADDMARLAGRLAAELMSSTIPFRFGRNHLPRQWRAQQRCGVGRRLSEF